MTYRQGEVLGRVERRWRFSLQENLAVLAEASAPGVVTLAAARRHGLLPAQVFKWRRLAALGGDRHRRPRSSFVAVEVAEDAAADAALATEPVAARPAGTTAAAGLPAAMPVATSGPGRPGVSEIELGAGRCVRVVGAVDADALSRIEPTPLQLAAGPKSGSASLSARGRAQERRRAPVRRIRCCNRGRNLLL